MLIIVTGIVKLCKVFLKYCDEVSPWLFWISLMTQKWFIFVGFCKYLNQLKLAFKLIIKCLDRFDLNFYRFGISEEFRAI